MSLLDKSQDLILKQFFDKQILPFQSNKNIFKGFSLNEYKNIKTQNSVYKKTLRIFQEKSLFKPITYPLKNSILTKIDGVKKFLPIYLLYCFLIDFNFKKLKPIYSFNPKVTTDEIRLNPLLIKKLHQLDKNELKKSLSFLLTSKKEINIFKLNAPANNLIGLLIYESDNKLTNKITEDILSVIFLS